MEGPQPCDVVFYRLQRGANFWLRPRHMVLSSPQLATDSVHPERDDDPGAGAVQRGVGTGRGAVLARLGCNGADGGGHWVSALA